MSVLAMLPRWVWAGLGSLGLLLALWGWHGHEVRQARMKGAAAQAALDRAAFAQATQEAAVRQARLVRDLAVAQSMISKGVEDGLADRFADLARRSDDLRLRWAAARAAGAAGAGGAVAVPGTPGGTDDAACAARGWVAFDTAAAAAHAADQAIAKDDAWISWARAQAAAWPD
jgi:hypothetical protein